MKKILVIGAGVGQEYLVGRAKRRGDYVVVVSPPGNYPAIPLADALCPLDIYDKDAIVDYAKKESFDAVISDQSDLAMPIVAYVAKALELPGNSVDTAILYSNKNVFREAAEKIGIPVPRHLPGQSGDTADKFASIPLPWIVKPEDSQSSMGVSKVDTVAEFPEAMNFALRYSKNARVIVEEFFPGREVVSEGIVYKGKYHLIDIGDRIYFDLGGKLFIPSRTLFPSTVSDEMKRKIHECEIKLAEFAKPNFGLTHSEYLVDQETGSFRAIEAALRGGGMYLSSHVLPLSTGLALTDILLDCACGMERDLEKRIDERQNRSAGYIGFYLPEGEIVSIRGMDELKKMPFVKHIIATNFSVGMKVGKMIHKGMRKGPIIIDAENRTELDARIEEVTRTLRIEVRTASGKIEGIVWK